MKNNIKQLVFTLVLAFGLIVPIFGGALQDEIDLEESLRNRVQRTIDGVFGPGNFIIHIDAILTSPRYEVKYTKESDPVRRKKKTKGEGEYSILPGYSVIKNLAPADLHKLPFDSVTNYIKPRVIRIVVNVLVNNKFPRGKRGRVKALIIKVLDLNEKRGDKVEFKPQKFYVETEGMPQPIKIIQRERLLTYQNFFNLILLLGLITFLVLYVIFQLRRPEKEGEGESSTNISVNPNIELPQGMGGGPSGNLKLSSAPAIKQYFDFIHEGNIDKVIYLMKKEQIGLEHIKEMVSFLPPRLASKLLTELDIKSQAIIAVNMLEQSMVNKAGIEKFEEKVKLWLECLSGGEQVFQEVFNFVPTDKKKKMLDLLGKSNAEGYKKVRSNIILFDDLRFLDDEEIKLILSEVSMDLLSVALCSAEKETYQKIERNLIKTSKAMVEQFLQLKGVNLAKKESEGAQATILEIVLRLENEGKLSLKNKIKV